MNCIRKYDPRKCEGHIIIKSMKLLKIILITLTLILAIACEPIGDINSPVPHTPDSKLETKTSTKLPVQSDTLYPLIASSPDVLYPAWVQPTIAGINLSPPLTANIPESGKASISGIIYAYNIQVPLSSMTFVLMPAVEIDGNFVVPPIITYGDEAKGDVIFTTDADGVFFIDNIEPGKYYLIVNYPDRTEVAVESNFTSKNRLFEFEPDMSYPLGIVFING